MNIETGCEGSRRWAARPAVALWLALGAALGAATPAAHGEEAPRPLQTERPEKIEALDTYVESAMRGWGAPGLALVVVRDDEVVTRAYGVSALEDGEPVDADTLFAIGSLTKAFTATLLATLVDDGAIGWDDPVVRHLPELALHDPWITRHLTIRDLLSHRTGLPGDDLMWAAGGDGPRELIRRLRFQEPTLGFRAGAGYHNVMYLVAGELAAAVAGESWEDLMRERILDPLGMTRSTTGHRVLRRRPNVALPHDEIGPRQWLGNAPSADVPLDGPTTMRRIDWHESATRPAGGMASTAAELGRWLRLQLATGTIDGRRVVGEESLLATRTPIVPVPGFPPSQSEPSETNLAAYGLGWDVRDYRGRLMLLHRGSTPGWGASASLLPTEDLGVAVLTNITNPALADAILHWVVDRSIGAEAEDWNEQALARAEARRRTEIALRTRAAEARKAGTRPSLPLAAYAGTYVADLYPAAEVTFRDGRLRLVLGPNLSGDLDPWQDDTFRVTWDRAEFGANLVTFAVGEGAHPTTVAARILGREAVWSRRGAGEDG